ncbi:MAG: hypothetical protein ACP5SI_01330 [Chloroflexia bacterium]
MIICPNCRALNPDTFAFCGRCGKPLREKKEAEKEPEEVPSWLKELGEGLVAGPGPTLQAGGMSEPPPWLAQEKPAPEEGAAELPPWLVEEAPGAEEAPAELPPWLGEGAPGAEEAPAELPPWLVEEAPVVEEGAGAEAGPAELPPWLGEEGLVAEEAPEAAAAFPEEPGPERAPWIEGLEAELPAWLGAAEGAPEGKEAFPAEAALPQTGAEPLLASLLEELGSVPPAGEEEAPAVPEGEAPPSVEEPVGLEALLGKEGTLPELRGEEEALVIEEAPVEGFPFGEVEQPAVSAEGAEPTAEAVSLEIPPAEAVSAPGPELPPPSCAEPKVEAVPEWVHALQPQEEGQQIAFLEGLELPEWLRVEEKYVEEAPAEPTFTWLERLEEEAEPVAVEHLVRPPLPPLSPARRRAADLFGAIVAAPEPVPKARPAPAPSFLKRLLRWLGSRWPALFLLCALLVGWALPSSQPEITQRSWPVLERMDQVLRGAEGGDAPVVLVAFDWDVHRIGEMYPLATTLMRHLLRPLDPQKDPRKRPAVVAVSTTFQGGYVAQEVWETMRAASGYEGVEYGTDFLNLSMRPGGESALRLLASQPITRTFPVDHLFGQPADYYLLGKRLKSLSEVNLLVIMAGEEERAVAWLEQVRSRHPDLPCILLVPAELRPVLEPYLQARGIAPDGALWGLAAALEYEDWLGRLSGIVVHRDLPLEKRLNLLAVAQLSLVALVVLGNLLPSGRDGMDSKGT